MFNYIIRKIFGTRNERELKKLLPLVNHINSLEENTQALSDTELRDRTEIFRRRLQQGETMEDLLPEAFAVVRETGRRVLNMRHFDVQLMGGIILHRGKIAEMKTGEGKTLVATLPGYLNALSGKGVHIVTVNDYLAGRDAEWMGAIYRFLGLTVGCIQHDMPEPARQEAYAADITFGTNNEFGFDYLRDNMKFERESLVQREFHYAIVDEVDSILIDEARTPLIISGPTEESTSFYYAVNDFVRKAVQDPKNFDLDEKTRTVVLTESAISAAEQYFKISNLYDLTNMDTLHQINQALKAHLLFHRDKDYLVKDNQVMIVDEFTGRMMPGRRYSDGLHQALEAKENVRIEQEYQTLAQVTFQNYFRMYDKLGGMTGTAMTEAAEFASIYDLDVIEVPTNRPLIRREYPDMIYGSREEKWNAVAEEIRGLHERGQPVLVGTISIENSELLARRLRRERVPHVVLNAKHHEKEADIVAQAGRPGAVTIATNMAGRGTDILLGGNPEYMVREELAKKGFSTETAPETIRQSAEEKIQAQVKENQAKVISLGGLHILGTERHEARRIDNQLRGRSGRQGDPGSSRFYISLEDDLMRVLGSERVKGLLVRAGMRDGVPIENKLVSKAIENAQKQIEGQNFSIRKHLLEYDDVMNKQRQVIYAMRRDIMYGKDMRDEMLRLTREIAADILGFHVDPKKDEDDWSYEGLHKEMLAQFGLDITPIMPADFGEFSPEEVHERLQAELLRLYTEKEALVGPGQMRELERMILLQIIDTQWKDQLLNMDHLKEGIGLRGYAQRDPLIEYKKESFRLFEELQNRIEEEVIRFLFLFHPVEEEEVEKWRRKKETKLSRPSSRMPGRKGRKKHKKKR
ncbi:MAG TPA: preprotein translocase subunit SecA [Candidatus Aminicenantes bacterium]|nr:preprotein translocase subunit SecA [Candidatus Aminicenantes bacterium]